MRIVLDIPESQLAEVTHYAEAGRLFVEEYIILAVAEKLARAEHAEWLKTASQAQET